MQGQQAFAVDKAELITILKENRSVHLEKYEKAIAKFREAAIAKLTTALHHAKEGRKIRLRIDLTEPTRHTEDYDTVIGLLELSKDETVQLSWNDYKQYVKDEWSWANQFNATASAYLEE